MTPAELYAVLARAQDEVFDFQAERRLKTDVGALADLDRALEKALQALSSRYGVDPDTPAARVDR